MLQMDPEALQALENTFQQQAGAVQTLQSTVQSALDNTLWQSPAAEQFRSLWSGEFVPALNNLATALEEAKNGVANSRQKVVEANSAI